MAKIRKPHTTSVHTIIHTFTDLIFFKIVRNVKFQFLLIFADELDIFLKLNSLLIEYYRNFQYLFCKNISITFEVFDTNAFFHKYRGHGVEKFELDFDPEHTTPARVFRASLPWRAMVVCSP